MEIYIIVKILDIPERIVNKVPSADLWEGQTNEDEIGMDYTTIDMILVAIKDKKTEHIDDKLLFITDRIDKNTHKNKMPPICKF